MQATCVTVISASPFPSDMVISYNPNPNPFIAKVAFHLSVEQSERTREREEMPRALHLPVTPTIALNLSYNGLEIFVASEQCLRDIVGSHGQVRRAREQGRARLCLSLARCLSVRFARHSEWKVTSAMNSFPFAFARRTNICFKFIGIYCCLFLTIIYRRSQ